MQSRLNWRVNWHRLCSTKRADLKGKKLLNVNLIFFPFSSDQTLPAAPRVNVTVQHFSEMRRLSHSAAKRESQRNLITGDLCLSGFLGVNWDWWGVPEKHQRTRLWSWYRFTRLPCQTASWELIKYFNRNLKRPFPRIKLQWRESSEKRWGVQTAINSWHSNTNWRAARWLMNTSWSASLHPPVQFPTGHHFCHCSSSENSCCEHKGTK